MTLRHLIVFSKVCETLNMTTAADQLYLSQPTISSYISDLEAHYNVKLFERKHNRLFSTPSGEQLYLLAQDVITSFRTLENTMCQGQQKSLIRIGVSMTVEAYLISKIIAKYSKKNELVPSFSINSYPTSELETMLIDRSLDFAIVEGKIVSSKITTIPLMNDELVFFCNTNSHICEELQADNPSLSPAKLSQIPLLFRDSQKNINNALYSRNIVVRPSGHFSTLEGIKDAVSNDLGIGIISRLALTESDNFKIVSVEGVKLNRMLTLAHPADANLTKSLRDFINFVIDYIRND